MAFVLHKSKPEPLRKESKHSVCFILRVAEEQTLASQETRLNFNNGLSSNDNTKHLTYQASQLEFHSDGIFVIHFCGKVYSTSTLVEVEFDVEKPNGKKTSNVYRTMSIPSTGHFHLTNAICTKAGYRLSIRAISEAPVVIYPESTLVCYRAA